MSFPRNSTLLAMTLATTLLLGGTVHAGEVSMAGGSVTFHTPDNWLTILQTEGDPEAQVFQVPDPSPTGKTSLARITVTVKHVPDISSFHQFRAEADARAMALPGYKVVAAAPVPDSNFYTARETGTDFSYVEHYWLKNGHAIQLRCVRPSKSLAGATWMANFDKGCAAIAAQLK
ncbi:MAG: hypothetical protein KGH90_05205 [Xanthomonadaceae bacterium]|nr:hypothetical protein [Xanthomonadaceae bacterium]